MPEAPGNRVEIAEELQEVTHEAAEVNPLLRADPRTATEGVLDDEMDSTERDAREMEIDEELATDAVPPTPPTERVTIDINRVLKLALTQKGPRERPSGSNRNAFSAYFGYGPQYWCADFVSWAIDRCGNRDKRVPWGYPSAVRNITAWGNKNGRIHNQPRRGDIFTYRNAGHTGFVTKVRDSQFTTVEGNVGDSVKSLERDAASGKYYFITPP
jgi:hypothetical protein